MASFTAAVSSMYRLTLVHFAPFAVCGVCLTYTFCTTSRIL